ncbi:MAG: FtsX-like permease family protein [Verrucomicrobiales bacterium]|nr:FtsX-like permease family protein [Verrucomicrobiales bacterium]
MMKSDQSGPHSLIWTKVIWRQWCREPKVPAVLILILALGVAVFLAVRLANRAAVTGFSLFTESISGDSDLLVRPRAGSFPESDLMSLREKMGATPATLFPILDTTAAAGPGAEAEIFRIIGTDFVALPNAVYLSDDETGSPIAAQTDGFSGMLGKPDQVFISRVFADESGKDTGDKLQIYVEGRQKELTISGIVESDPLRPQVPRRLLVFDLPGAQKLTGNEGLLSRLEVKIPPGPDFQNNLQLAREKLTEWAGDRFVVETPGQRKDSATRMSAAFRLNLTILSTLALIVGAYLILQAMEAAVIRRRSEIAILRCLGVTPGEIQKAWLMESLVLGLLGSALGVMLGVFLAQGMVGAIASTVNTLYYETTSRSAAFDPVEAGFAFLFGVVISLLAGSLPAREAANTPAAHAVATGIRGGGLKLLQHPLPGWVFLLLGLLVVKLPPFVTSQGSTIPVGGYAGALFFLLGISILAGHLFCLIARMLAAGNALPERVYASSQFRLPGGRHRLAAAGLLAAFGMSAAMGILVASFETTLNSWIRQMLKADVYVAAAGAQSAISENKIPGEVWKEILATPGIEAADRLRRYSIHFEGKDTWLAGSEYNNSERRLQLIWIKAPENTAADALTVREGDTYPAWVSESFSRVFQRSLNDRFPVPTPDGPKSVVVKGIYADYGSERGTVLLSRRFTSQWYEDDALNNLALYLQEGIDEETWLADFQNKFPGLVARTNRTLREDALRLFRQTFSVTYALEGIAIIIAVAGLGLAMVGLLLERREELSTLKEIGMTRRRIAAAAMWEGLGLSIAGVVGGLLLSLILGWILVYVVNRQSFGWTLNFTVPWLTIAALSCAMLATGSAVAWFTGYRIANLKSDLEEE